MEVKETGDSKFRWGLFIDGELFGWTRHRFDADFAKRFIELHGIEKYKCLMSSS